MIECEPETPTWYLEALQDRVHDFWEAAQQDIWSDWMRETDPANLQPRVRPINLRVAEFIRTNPPIDMPDAQVTRSLDILESPWPRREEIMLREWFESKSTGARSFPVSSDYTNLVPGRRKLHDLAQAGKAPPVFGESDDPARLVPIVSDPDHFMIAVTGDPLRTNAYAFSHNGRLGFPTAKRIDLPRDWNAKLAAAF